MQADGTIKPTKFRDSVGRPVGAKADKSSTIRAALRVPDDKWPRYEPYSDDEFLRNLTSAPFAMHGPVFRDPASKEDLARSSQEAAHGDFFVAVDTAFRGIFNASCRQSDMEYRDPSNAHKMRDQRKKPTVSPQQLRQQQRMDGVNPGISPQRKRRRTGIHCANIRDLPAAQQPLEAVHHPTCAIRAKRMVEYLTSAGQQPASPRNGERVVHEAAADANAPQRETPSAACGNRTTWLAELWSAFNNNAKGREGTSTATCASHPPARRPASANAACVSTRHLSRQPAVPYGGSRQPAARAKASPASHIEVVLPQRISRASNDAMLRIMHGTLPRVSGPQSLGANADSPAAARHNGK